MSGTLYIVDGYNVLHALFRGADREEIFARRDWLVNELAGLTALHGARAVLVCSTAAALAARAAGPSEACPSRWSSPAALSPPTR